MTRVLIRLLLLACVPLALASGCSSAEETPATASITTIPAVQVTRTATPGVEGSPAPTPTPTPDDRVASTFATPTSELPAVEFTRADGGVVRLPLEVPPRDEYGVGLSGRYHLDGRGMLFYYPGGDTTTGFWMQDTHIDLSIAFVDAEGRILDIFEMKAESTDIVRPAEPYEAAIEAPAGWYREHGIRPGDEARFDFEIPPHLLDG